MPRKYTKDSSPLLVTHVTVDEANKELRNEYQQILAGLKVFQTIKIELGVRPLTTVRSRFLEAANTLGCSIVTKSSPDKKFLFLRREPKNFPRRGPYNKLVKLKAQVKAQ